jgi:hypothetical protein
MSRAPLLKIVLLYAVARCSISLLPAETQYVSPSDTRPCGTFSDYLIPNPVAGNSSSPRPPVLVDLMASRYRDLLWVSAGYRLTGMPLIAHDGKKLFLVAPGDDPGLYYIVPWMSRALHLSLEASIDLLLISALGLGFMISFVGCMLVLGTTGARVYASLALLCLTAIAARVGDVYVVEFATTVALVPWVLYVIGRDTGNYRLFQCFAFGVGLVGGIGSLIRFGSAPTVLAVLAILLLVGVQVTLGKRTLLVAILLAGFLIPRLALRHVLNGDETFLQQRVAGYRQRDSRYVLGHFAYEGLGFLSNPYVPGGVCDEVAKDKVRAMAGSVDYMSSEYNRILRHEVISIARQHPALVAFTIFAKLGVVAGLIAIFANIGLVAALRYPKSWKLELAFWTAFAICAAPLVLMAPLPMYCLGLISLAVMYGIVSFDHCLTTRKLGRPLLRTYHDNGVHVFVGHP